MKKLFDYQREWSEDEARATITLAARQIGMSFAAMERIKKDCEAHPGMTWTYYTTGERAVIDWSKKLTASSGGQVVRRVEEWSTDHELREVDILLHNGSRIHVQPYGQEIGPGRSGKAVLDNFAFSGMSERWISAAWVSFRDGLHIISAMNSGDADAAETFARLWHEPNALEKRKIDIMDAAKSNPALDPQDLRKGISKDVWRRQFLCLWNHEASPGTVCFRGLKITGKLNLNNLKLLDALFPSQFKPTNKGKLRMKIAGIVIAEDKKTAEVVRICIPFAGHYETCRTTVHFGAGRCVGCTAEQLQEHIVDCDRAAIRLGKEGAFSGQVHLAMKDGPVDVLGYCDADECALVIAMHYALEACANRLANIAEAVEGK